MAANDSALTCGADFTFQEMLLSAIGKDSAGNATLRVYKSAAVTGQNRAICGGAADQTETNAIIKELFCINAVGDVAIRMSIP